MPTTYELLNNFNDNFSETTKYTNSSVNDLKEEINLMKNYIKLMMFEWWVDTIDYNRLIHYISKNNDFSKYSFIEI